MRIFYITNSRLPTEKAHGVQIAKMCEALLEAKIVLTLVIPKRNNPIKQSIEDYYGLRLKVPIKSLWTLDLFKLGFLDFVTGPLQLLTFYFGVLAMTLRNRKTVVFTRDHYSPLFCFNKTRIIWEIHELPRNYLGRQIIIFLAKRCRQVICVNKSVFDFFAKNNLPGEKLHLLPNAVDLELFSELVPVKKARETFGLPMNKKIVLYTGGLYKRKGVYTLVDAVKHLPKNLLVVLVGGPEEEKVTLEKYIKVNDLSDRIIVRSSIAYNQIPVLLQAADILVLPNSAIDVMSGEQTSPLKLAEYLASGKKIVASNVPGVQFLVPKGLAVFFNADDAVDLARAVLKSLETKPPMVNLEQYSLKYRVKHITKLLGNSY